VDRQLGYFKFRIQQAISLCDDEIERLDERLTSYKAELRRLQEEIDQTDRQIIEVQEHSRGELQRRKAGSETALARLRAAHHQRAQDLQRSQTTEIDRLQEVFEAELASLTKAKSDNHESRVAAIDAEIRKVCARIKSYGTELAKLQESRENAESQTALDGESVTGGVVEELQQLIRSRNDERLANLTESRSKLAKCVDALDGIVRSHAIRVEELHRRIQAQDERYQERVEAAKIHGEAQVDRMKQELGIIERRTVKLGRAARRVAADNVQYVRQSERQLERRKLGEVAPVLDASNDQSDIQKLQREIASLEKEKATAESDLILTRQENEQVRRAIGRIRHEITFANRGPGVRA
jgi:chromosome segregation ATPase